MGADCILIIMAMIDDGLAASSSLPPMTGGWTFSRKCTMRPSWSGP